MTGAALRLNESPFRVHDAALVPGTPSEEAPPEAAHRADPIPTMFTYDRTRGAMGNIVRGIAFAARDYPGMRAGEIRDVLNTCRRELKARMRGNYDSQCRYGGAQRAVYLQVMEICNRCAIANWDREVGRGVGASAAGSVFAPYSVAELRHSLLAARKAIPAEGSRAGRVTCARRLQEEYYPRHAPARNAHPGGGGEARHVPASLVLPAPDQNTLPVPVPFEGFLSAHSQPHALAAAFGCMAPDVVPHYRLHPNSQIKALLRPVGASKASFRTVRWATGSASHDGAFAERYVYGTVINRRCLLQVDAFFVRGGIPAQWYRLHPRQPGTAFTVAAVLDPQYAVQDAPDKHPVVLLTIPAPPIMRGMRQTRCPMILPPSVWKPWIEQRKLTHNDIGEMARSLENIEMALHPIGGNLDKYKGGDMRCSLSDEEIRARGWKVNRERRRPAKRSSTATRRNHDRKHI